MNAATVNVSPVDRLLEKLGGGRRSGNQWMAVCPAHPDSSPSLSITEGDDGRALVHCHAGCATADILNAVGLDACDLFAGDKPRGGRPVISSTYPYHDEDGVLLFEVVRFTPKDFRQRKPDGRNGWTWSTRGVRRVLYRLPDIVKAVKSDAWVFVCEGEKDADALVRAGYAATTNPGGAGKWSHVPDAPAVLAGATVVIVADRDGPGHAHAREVARTLIGIAAEVTVVEPAEGKDAADHLAAGLGVADFTPLAGTGLEDHPLDQWLNDDDQGEDDEGEDPFASLDPVDLGPALAGERDPIEPTLLARDDGRGLIYPGQVNGLHAKDGVGKSWVALFVAVEQLNAGHKVLWVDFEDPNEVTIAERLVALGVAANVILESFRYVNPDIGLMQLGALPRIMRHVDDTVSLVIVDSIGEAFALDGVNENNDDEVTPWMKRVLRRIAEAGPAVLMIDHATNANDDPLRASGSKRKRASVTGHQMLVEAPTPFAKGQPGKLRLTCAKDRHGNYRRKEVVADIVVTVDDGGVGFKVWAPTDPKGEGPDELEVATSAAFNALLSVDDGDLVSRNELEERMKPFCKFRAQTKRAGIDAAVRQGRIVEVNGARNARLYSLPPDLVPPRPTSSGTKC